MTGVEKVKKIAIRLMNCYESLFFNQFIKEWSLYTGFTLEDYFERDRDEASRFYIQTVEGLRNVAKQIVSDYLKDNNIKEMLSIKVGYLPFNEFEVSPVFKEDNSGFSMSMSVVELQGEWTYRYNEEETDFDCEVQDNNNGYTCAWFDVSDLLFDPVEVEVR